MQGHIRYLKEVLGIKALPMLDIESQAHPQAITKILFVRKRSQDSLFAGELGEMYSKILASLKLPLSEIQTREIESTNELEQELVQLNPEMIVNLGANLEDLQFFPRFGTLKTCDPAICLTDQNQKRVLWNDLKSALARLAPVFAFILLSLTNAKAQLSTPLTAQEDVTIRVKTGSLIQEIPLETYLEGVLPSEMPASWPMEALKAQAIASRSFALAQKKIREKQSYDVESSILDQVYRPEHVNGIGTHYERVRKAIWETRGEVVQDKGEIVKTYFHSDCGGSTDSAQSVWGPVGTTVLAKDSGCSLRKKSEWEFEVSLTELSLLFGIERIEKIFIKSKSLSQRVRMLEVRDTKGATLNVSGERLREVVGYSRVKSTRFDLIPGPYSIKFVGRGYGHGVGLCQQGTRFLAELGKNHKNILAHYFPKTTISSLYKESYKVAEKK